MKGEASTTDYGFSSVAPVEELKEPEALIHTTEPSLTDRAEVVEELEKGEVQPPPTAEVRRFSVDWDPIQ